ncbi:conserved hypothetical protein [Burkholderia multivorans CGD2M]|nr:conserved hypothetical protein [Burkholderia multivorans CGD2M]
MGGGGIGTCADAMQSGACGPCRPIRIKCQSIPKCDGSGLGSTGRYGVAR